MKNKNIYIKKANNVPVLLMLVLFSMTIVFFASCNKEDDIPPPSAYIAPVPDTTGACVFLTGRSPELNGDEAIDFECEGPDYTFFGEKDGAITIEYVENPAKGGINTSEKVVQVTQTAGIEPWAGFFFDLSSKIDFSTYQGVKIKFYSPSVGQMMTLKLEDSADGDINSEISLPTTVANEWEELTYTFSSGDTDKFDRVVLFFDYQGPKDAETIHYFDDIILGEGEIIVPPTEPTTAAPTPTVAEVDVISLFSDAYTNVEGTDFNPNWGQGTVVTQVDIAGNNTLKYENLNYQGIVLENSIDVSGMSFLHVDYWTENSTGFNGFLISSGPAETPHAFEVTIREWVSIDIPLSEFSSVVDLMDVIQMKFDGNGTIYLDNIYFHKEPTGPSTAAPTPTVAESDVISLFSDAYTNVEGTDFNPNWGQGTVVTQVDIAGNNTLKYENLNYQGIALASSIDVSGMNFLHVDYWTPNSTGFNGFLISTGPAETPHAFAVTTGEWVSVNIPLEEFSSVVDLTDVIQMKFDGNGTIYLDNIYFHRGQATEPFTAAPTPTVLESDVISVFSDAYSNVEGTDFNPNWGQGTVVTQENIAGNKVLKYENLNYQGTQFASALDVSGMSMLHIDYWTANSTGFNGFLISTGPAETLHTFEVTTGQWVSVDIPLSTFSSVVNLMDVIQLKFDGDGTIYLDNIYFHK
ncbi:MAG: hypothetical protein R3E32_06615 [Chitinophagales bacterium]